MADISKIILPSGAEYNIKDAVARRAIETLSGYTKYLGVTTTALEDGVTTSAIVVIAGESITAVKGDIVNYQTKEFIYNGTVWQEFGDLSSLGALAHEDSASGDYTPAGSVTFDSSTAQAITVGAADSGEATYIPEGSVSAPAISVGAAGATDIIHNPTAATVAKTIVAAAPSATAPDNAITYYSVTDEALSLYQLGYTVGDSITTTDVAVKTGDASYVATAPTFTGAGARLVAEDIAIPTTATFTGTPATVTVTATSNHE